MNSLYNKQSSNRDIGKVCIVDGDQTRIPRPCVFQISGREMFEFNPALMADDDDDAGDDVYTREDRDEEDGVGTD